MMARFHPNYSRRSTSNNYKVSLFLGSTPGNSNDADLSAG